MTTQLAPKAEGYIQLPRFKFTPKPREIDFAQLVASGSDPVRALILAKIVTEDDVKTLPKAKIYSVAASLIKSEAIQERIQYFAILHRRSMAVTAERILQEGAAIAFADFAEAYDHDGRPFHNPHNIPRHLRAAIKEYKIDKDGVTHIKFHDKLKAMQLIGDLEGLFDDAHRAKAPQVTINLGGAAAHKPDANTAPDVTSGTLHLGVSGDDIIDIDPSDGAAAPDPNWMD
jgi:hypothetical protein